MKEPGLDDRHRDKDGEISRKHGNTLVRTLRQIYGASFASGFAETDKLSEVLRSCLEILRPPPTGFRTLQSMAQYSLNPDRCQRATVSGRTIRSAFFQ